MEWLSTKLRSRNEIPRLRVNAGGSPGLGRCELTVTVVLTGHAGDVQIPCILRWRELTLSPPEKEADARGG